MNVLKKVKELVRGVKAKKSFQWIVVGAVCFCVIAIYLILTPQTGKKSASSTSPNPSISYAESIENKLKTALSKIKGVGDVEVAICFEGTEEIVIAYVESIQSNGASTLTPQLISSGGAELPLVLQTIYPKVVGVIIVAEGAQDVSIKLKLLDAACTYLGVESDVVNVYEG